MGRGVRALPESGGRGRLSATVLLPRREVIVRQIALPGVAAKDIEGAIRFQLDTLHPYGENDVVWGWSPLAYGGVLVGIVLRSTDRALCRPVCRGRYRGAQLHVFGGGGTCGHPAEWRADTRARDSWR